MSEVAVKRRFAITFGSSGRPPVELEEGDVLSEKLTVQNSPLLFGCRTGICGTCLSLVDAAPGALPAPNEEEKELLALLCPNEPRARLACRLRACAEISIEPLKA